MQQQKQQGRLLTAGSGNRQRGSNDDRSVCKYYIVCTNENDSKHVKINVESVNIKLSFGFQLAIDGVSDGLAVVYVSISGFDVLYGSSVCDSPSGPGPLRVQASTLGLALPSGTPRHNQAPLKMCLSKPYRGQVPRPHPLVLGVLPVTCVVQCIKGSALAGGCKHGAK